MYCKYRIVESIANSVSQYESYRDQVYRYTPSSDPSAGPSHHRHAGSDGLLGLTGPGRPYGRLLHLHSLRPRTCGCHGSLRLGRPVAQTLGRKLKDLFQSKYLNWAVHCQVLMVWWVDHTSRVVIIMCWVSNSCWVVIIMCWVSKACWVVIIMCWISHACWFIHDLWLVIRCWVMPPCWLVTRQDDPSSFAESGTWAALPCQVVIPLGPSHCEDDPSREAEPCN